MSYYTRLRDSAGHSLGLTIADGDQIHLGESIRASDGREYLWVGIRSQGAEDPGDYATEIFLTPEQAAVLGDWLVTFAAAAAGIENHEHGRMSRRPGRREHQPLAAVQKLDELRLSEHITRDRDAP